MAAALQGGATWGMMEDAPEELDDVDENNGGCRGMHLPVGCTAGALLHHVCMLPAGSLFAEQGGMATAMGS